MSIEQMIANIIENRCRRPYSEEHKEVIKSDIKNFDIYSDLYFIHKYNEIEEGDWQFLDTYYNIVGIKFYIESNIIITYYIGKDLSEETIRLYDDEDKNIKVTQDSIKGGADVQRSNTIAKILRDEIIPRYLINNKNKKIQINFLDEGKRELFWKFVLLLQEKYPELTINKLPEEIQIIK
jgi:hypothetical protein